jgi:hypothetical protein
MRESNQLGPRVGNCRIPRLREQSDTSAAESRFQQLWQLAGVGVFVEHVDANRRQLPVQPHAPQECARASRFLRDEAVQTANSLEHRLWQHVRRLAFAERRRHQKQRTAGCHHFLR